jgi:hypothetical protein
MAQHSVQHVVKKMRIEDFESAYCPIENHIDDNSSLDGTMFETYGAELDYVKAQEPSCIWTYCDEDEGLFIKSGYHLANRLGHVITKNPWAKGAVVIVPID